MLEVGGKDTLPRALRALALGGQVALIGGLTGFDGQVSTGSISGVQGTVRGIYVGSRADFIAMNAFIAKHKLKPVVDKTFAFNEAPAAFQYLESGSHFGKVVIALSEFGVGLTAKKNQKRMILLAAQALSAPAKCVSEEALPSLTPSCCLFLILF